MAVSGDHQRADHVERIHQVIGEHQTQRAADPDGAGEEAQRREGERGAERQVSRIEPKILTPPACNSSLRIHFQESRKVSSGNEKRGGAEHLEEEIGEIGARVADEVERARGGGGIERRVLGMVRDQTQEHHQAQRKQQEPDDFIQPSMLSWR